MAQNNLTEAEKAAAEKSAAEKAAKDFDMKAYNEVVHLTLESYRRKNNQLTKPEKERLEAAEKVAYKNKGRKPLKTDTYRVQMKTVRLVKGLPTPESVVQMFSEVAQKKLFS